MKTHSAYKVFTLLFSLSFFNSCLIQGLTDDYGKLDENQKAKIVTLKNFQDVRHGFIYLINGTQLKEEITKYPKSIVYIFVSGCTSKSCKPLNVYENYAEKYGYKLFLVMDGFPDLDKTTDQEIKAPLFAIDSKYYKSTLRIKYVKYFTNELLGRPLKTKDSEYLGSIYFFKNGKFDKILEDLP